MADTITNEEYAEVQGQITIIASLMLPLNLGGFITAAEKASAFGPLLDPTLWMKGNKKLDAIKELALAARRFQSAAIKFRETMLGLETNPR